VTQSLNGWKQVFHDEHRRSFVAHRKEAFNEGLLREWWETLSTQISWCRPRTADRVLPRSAAWLTREGCTCSYEYSRMKFAPTTMPDWFLEITDRVCQMCGLRERPNACNANYYDSGVQAVGWHSDNEPLFDAVNQDTLIVSLSFGATRTFELRSKDNPFQYFRLQLENGDLCTMEGLCQKHYRHRVPLERTIEGPRINLTWRWVRCHDATCPHSRMQ